MIVDQGFASGLGSDLVIAAYFNWGLLGILCLQTYAYYIAFPRDRLLAKVLVYTVLVLEITQSAITSHDVYMALASSIGAADPLDMVDGIYTHWFNIPVAGGITGGIGQFFFAYRIWMMTTNSAAAFQVRTTNSSRGTPIIIGILAMASLVSALVAASTFFHAKTFSTLLDQEGGGGVFGSMAAIGVWNGIGAICDIVIALSMPYYLMRHGTGLPPTHVIVVKLVRLIFETGALTAIVSILHLCLYFGNNSAFIIPGLILSKMYANTMLVILNNRMELVSGAQRIQDESLRESQLNNSPRTPFRNPESSSRSRPRATIVVSHDRLTFRMDSAPPMPKPVQLKKTEDLELSSLSSRSAVDFAEKGQIRSFDPTRSDSNTDGEGVV